MTLPKEAAQRKAIPIASGVLGYFPDAIAAVAECSQKGNEQHHPGFIESAGIKKEKAFAINRGIPISYLSPEEVGL